MIVGRAQPYTASVALRLHAWALAPFPVAGDERLSMLPDDDPTTSGCDCEGSAAADGGLDEDGRLSPAFTDTAKRASGCGCDVREPVRIVAPLPDWKSPPVEDDDEVDRSTFLDPDDEVQDP